MGRIKTAKIKRVTLELYKQHQDKLKTNFEDNKLLVNAYTDVKSKKLRNIIAGYATRLKLKQTD